MRYYVLAIQHNMEKDEENRTAPKAFNTLNDAIKAFHKQLADDMGNATLDWSLCMIINSDCGIYKSEKWVREVEPIVEEVVEKVTE